MSIYGSSPFNISGYTLVANLPLQGPRGPKGFTGAQGNPGYGPTGPTGSAIDFLTYIDKIVNTIYEDQTTASSQQISELPGGYILDLNGSTSGSYSPLQSIEILYNTNQVYNGIGNNKTFNQIKQFNFKNIKTNSNPFIELSYSDPITSNGIAQPGRVINVRYNVYNLGTTNVSGGPSGTLVVNNPGNFQSGYTGATFNITQNAASFSTLNVAEQLVVLHPLIFGDTNKFVWVIDPDIGSIFYLKDFQLFNYESLPFTGYYLLIKENSSSSVAKSFSVIFPKQFYTGTIPLVYSTYSNISDVVNENMGSLYRQKFKNNIIWQYDSYFCPSQKYDVVNFISIGSRYIGIPSFYDTNLNTSTNIQTTIPVPSCYPSNYNLFRSTTQEFSSGICCKNDCTCELSSNFTCNGYFYEGITCGGISGPCSTIGACCLFDDAKYLECKEIRYCDCATIANESNLSFVWNPFKNLKTTCADFNCQNAKNQIGACCDGYGNCSEISENDCDLAKRYYQGHGVNCTNSNNLNVCLDGYGACCDSGITCEAGITGSICIQQYKTYFGDGTTCGEFSCSASSLPCYSIIENEILYPGKEYDGGVIVGIFNPKNTQCLGTTLFDGSLKTFSALTGVTQTTPVQYNSKYDFSGYGFSPSEICSDEEDSYIMILSPHPVNIDSNKNLIDGTLNTNTFQWSNGSVSWGPLVNISNSSVDEFENNNLHFKEGYVYSTINESSSKLSLHENTFLTCSAARFDTDPITILSNKPPQSITGNWTRNFGLYNTIRLVGSEYFYYNIGISSDGATLSNYTPVSSNITAARALSIYINSKTTGNTYSSQWYIPSIDELGFLSNMTSNTSEFNLNSRLVELGYTPLNDWHWSSTGCFNTNNNEGILTASGITHGSEAWAVKFDIDGNYENMLVGKKSRTEQYKIRPIKLLRCDKKYYSINDLNYKLWNIPVLSEFIIDN